MKRTILVLIAVLASGPLASSIAFAGYTPSVVPASVYAGYSGTPGPIYVDFPSTNTGCTNTHIIQFSTDPAKVLTVVMAAFLAGRQVVCSYSGCSGGYAIGGNCQIM